LKDYMDHLFKVISPGHRFVASIGDTTPAGADFERLLYIGERIEKEGRLPLKAGTYRPIARESLEAVGRGAPHPTAEPAPPTPGDGPYPEVLKDVLQGDREKLLRDVKTLVDQGADAQEILNVGMLPAMETIGARFSTGKVFIPEVLMSARALNEALKVLEPHLGKSDRRAAGKILMGTVRGDLHDIGKNMVMTMLKGVGYEVVDLGVNVKIEDFLRAVEKENPDILGLSALLTTTMPQIRDVVNALAEAGLRHNVRVIIGGAPVNQKFADGAGADGYAPNAGAAVDLVRKMMRSGPPNRGR
jgi:5-methyltetrahydrofolate--homocysteine methyltransferase